MHLREIDRAVVFDALVHRQRHGLAAERREVARFAILVDERRIGHRFAVVQELRAGCAAARQCCGREIGVR